MTPVRAPAIGITSATIAASSDGGPVRVGQNQTYVRALVRAGAAPVLLPPLAAGAPVDPIDRMVDTLYRVIDGLLLSGGGDLDPALYGETDHGLCRGVSRSRDEMELRLARRALDGGKPLLAICRGIQVLNVALGGSLYQDIEAQAPGAERHAWWPGFPRDRLSHDVAVAPGTHLARILETASLGVNSLHHQAIKDLAPGLVIVARAPDGVVEAVEAGTHPFALGVQWHPEDLAAGDARHQRLFAALVDACRHPNADPGP